MITLIRFIARIATPLYVLAAIGVILSLRGYSQARQARRVAIFGLEREVAEEKQRRAMSTILLLFLLSGAVYISRNIVLPNISSEDIEPTPTSIVFVTQQPTSTQARVLYPTVTPTSNVPPVDEAGNPISTPDPTINGCEIIGTMLTNPSAGQTVSGQVAVEGQANILNFGQYKFELNGPATGGAWIVVGTSTIPVTEGYLGSWDSTSLPPGSYTFRLVVLRADGSYPPPCQIPIIIAGLDGGGAVPPTP